MEVLILIAIFMICCALIISIAIVEKRPIKYDHEVLTSAEWREKNKRALTIIKNRERKNGIKRRELDIKSGNWPTPKNVRLFGKCREVGGKTN